MSLALIFALVLMGFTFTVTQVMVIRELLVVFAGNELSIAIILANWLLLEAAGSFLIGKKVEEWEWREIGYALTQILIALLLPLTIYGIRCLRYISGLSPGEGASLLQIFIWTIPLLAPLGILDGILFALGCTLHSQSTARTPASIGRVYLLEALGAGLGGVLYTFFCIPLFNSFQVAFLLGAANLLSGLLLILRPEMERKKKGALGGLASFLLMVELALLTLSGSQTIEKSSMKRLWPGMEILQSRWSPYGNVTVGRREEQLTFFANGIPICNAPVPDIAWVEELVHYPLLLLASPQKVLIVGGGFGGVLHEVLKHPVLEIHYAEIDPLIIQLIRENLTPLTRGEMEDPPSRGSPPRRSILHKNNFKKIRRRPSEPSGSFHAGDEPFLYGGLFPGSLPGPERRRHSNLIHPRLGDLLRAGGARPQWDGAAIPAESFPLGLGHPRRDQLSLGLTFKGPRAAHPRTLYNRLAAEKNQNSIFDGIPYPTQAGNAAVKMAGRISFRGKAGSFESRR